MPKIRKKVLQNEVKYLRDPPAFDNLESTVLMKIFQDVIGKPVTEGKKSFSYYRTLVTVKFGTIILPLQILATLWSQSIAVLTKTSNILERNIKKRQE